MCYMRKLFGIISILFGKLSLKRNIIKEKVKNKSICYGICFFVLVPFFAIIYYFLPSNCWYFPPKMEELGVFDSLYFSIVSITTLGFGDIYPVSLLARILVSLESIGGIIFVGLFLNALSSEQANNISKAEEKKHQREIMEMEKNKLYLRKHMFEKRIERYLVYMYCVVTPLNERDFGNIQLNPSEIKINNMFDLYGPTMLMYQPVETSSLEVFLRVQDELFTEMSNIIKEVNIGYWPSLVIAINNYMSNCVDFEYKESLLSIKDAKLGKEPASKFCSDLIKNHMDDLSLTPSNVRNQFISLYYLIVHNLNEIQNIQITLSSIFDQES